METKHNLKIQKFCTDTKIKLRFKWLQFLYSDKRKKTTKNIFASLLSIIISLLFAVLLVIMIYGNGSLFSGIFKYIFVAPFHGSFETGNAKSTISSISIFAVAALSFIFAQKAGLFNIGISGQMMFGGQFGVITGFALHNAGIMPGLGQVLVVLVAMLAGAVIAVIIGLLKTYLNVNEVITSILFNWTIFFLGTLFVRTVANNMGVINSTGLYTEELPSDVSLNITNWTSTLNGAWLPLTIIIAIVIPVSIVILNYSTFGRKISTTGLSLTASTYAGINVKSKRIIAMLISGILAGLLGAMIYCGNNNQIFVTTTAKAIPVEGFNGISVGLISMNNPLAVLPISLFFAMVQNAKSTIQTELLVDPVITDLMFGIIVYGAAIISLMYYFKPWIWIRKLFDGKRNETSYNKFVHDQGDNIDNVISTIYTLKHYHKIGEDINAIRQKVIKLIALVNKNPDLGIHHDNFSDQIKNLKQQYVGKLPSSTKNKRLKKLLDNLIDLYEERTEFYLSKNTIEVLKYNNIEPKLLKDAAYINRCVYNLLVVALIRSKQISNNFEKQIILNKENNFNLHMIYKRLNRFYKDKLAEANKDYDNQKAEIMNNKSPTTRKVKIKELNKVYCLAIKELKFEIKSKKKMSKTNNKDENEVFSSFHNYEKYAYNAYTKVLKESIKKPKYGYDVMITPFYECKISKIDKFAQEIIEKQIVLGESYSLYEDQIKEIIHYKTKTAYKLVKNEIRDEYITSALNKQIKIDKKMAIGGNR